MGLGLRPGQKSDTDGARGIKTRQERRQGWDEREPQLWRKEDHRDWAEGWRGIGPERGSRMGRGQGWGKRRDWDGIEDGTGTVQKEGRG
jgi:hypothetical protein